MKDYESKYGETCDCPYCGAAQHDIDIDPGESVWNEETECESCGGKFKYDLEVTVEFLCYPISGEGPTDGNGNVIEPKFKDPNQLNIFSAQG